MPLVPFKLLPWWCWSSEGVSLSEFGTGPLRGTASESSSFFHHLQTRWFYSRKLWGLLFLALLPWAEDPDVRLGPLTTKTSLPNFYPPHVSVGLAHSTSVSSASLVWCGFFSSIVVWFLFSSISDCSEWSLVCRLVVILTWLCKEARSVYLCLHLDWSCK